MIICLIDVLNWGLIDKINNFYILHVYSIKIILVTRFNSDYVMNSLDCVNETIICLLHVVLGFKNTEVWLVIFLVMIGDPIAIC